GRAGAAACLDRAAQGRLHGEFRQPAAAQGPAREHRQDHPAVVSMNRTLSSRPRPKAAEPGPIYPSAHVAQWVPARARRVRDDSRENEGRMIITSVEFAPCVMPLEDKNWKFALGTASTSCGYIVRLTSDSGHTGYGYSNSSPHMGSSFETL